MKKCIMFLLVAILLTGCTDSGMKPLSDDVTETFDVQEEKPSATASPEPGATDIQVSKNLDDKFSTIDFYLVSGSYSRNVIQNETQIMEMFSLDKTNFIRVATGDFEQEIFAYNYVSDNFTYLYYFNDELVTKTVFNVGTGAILEDNDGFSELLKTKADELKEYFVNLISNAGIGIDEIS